MSQLARALADWMHLLSLVLLLEGNAEGSISSWRGCKWLREQAAHGRGPPSRRPDGTESHSGVRCLVLQAGHKHLLSGGADG